MDYKFQLVLGDRSNDGHEQSKRLFFECNLPLYKIRKAYKDSCKLVGLQFNINEDYTGLKKEPTKKDYDNDTVDKVYQKNYDLNLLCEYQNCCISEDQAVTLLSFGLPVKSKFDEESFTPEELSNLVLHFIRLTLPKLKWKKLRASKELRNLPFIEDRWDGIGYGLFDLES